MATILNPVLPAAPNRDEAQRFLEALTGEKDPQVTFQAFDDAKAGRDYLKRVLHGTLAERWDDLAQLNSDGAGIFVTVNTTDLKGRRKENIVALRALFVDSDTPLDPATLPLRPSIVVKTARGGHFYWTLRPGEPLEAFEGAQKALAERFGTDNSVHDLPRVLRLPGFLHKKDEAHPVPIRLVRTEPVRYTVAEVLKGTGAVVAANEPERDPALVTPLRTDAQLADDLARLYHALPVLAEHYRTRDSKLAYDEWTRDVVMPLQASFQDTALWPAVKRLFAKFTKRIPGYEPGAENKLEDFHRHADGTDGTVRRVDSIFGLADKLDPTWRERARDGGDGAADEDRIDIYGPLPEGLTGGADIFETDDPPPTYAIPPYLPHGEMVEAHGPHSRFKSTIMLYGALAVVTGEPWGGAPTMPGSAAFISLEDRARTVRRRVRRWVQGSPLRPADEERQGVRRAAIARDFEYLGREGSTGLVLVLTDKRHGRAEKRRAAVEWLKEHVQGRSLVVLETASRLNPAGEDNDSLAVLASALEEVATATGACIVLIRHVAKAQARAKAVDSYGGKGGGTFADMARGVLSFERDGDGPAVRMVHTKPYADGPQGGDLAWSPVADGDSVYLEEVAAADADAAKEQRREGKLVARLRDAGKRGLRDRDLDKLAPGGKHHEAEAAALRALAEKLVGEQRVSKTWEERGGYDGNTYRLLGEAGEGAEGAAKVPQGVAAPSGLSGERGTTKGAARETSIGAAPSAAPLERHGTRPRKVKGAARCRSANNK